MTTMQLPTVQGVRIRSAEDAHVVFHAVSLGLLPMVHRRLDGQERRYIGPGAVYVWEEKNYNYSNNTLGIERWTDSISWGPSRAKDDFLIYQEKTTRARPRDDSSSDSSESRTPHSRSSAREKLIKQTYSATNYKSDGTKAKWHLTCYYTESSLRNLYTVDDVPMLYSIQVPPGKYKPTRSRPAPPDTFGPIDLGYDHPKSSENTITSPSSLSPVWGSSRRPELPPLQFARQQPPPRRHPIDVAMLDVLNVYLR